MANIFYLLVKSCMHFAEFKYENRYDIQRLTLHFDTCETYILCKVAFEIS